MCQCRCSDENTRCVPKCPRHPLLHQLNMIIQQATSYQSIFYFFTLVDMTTFFHKMSPSPIGLIGFGGTGVSKTWTTSTYTCLHCQPLPNNTKESQAGVSAQVQRKSLLKVKKVLCCLLIYTISYYLYTDIYVLV